MLWVRLIFISMLFEKSSSEKSSLAPWKEPWLFLPKLKSFLSKISYLISLGFPWVFLPYGLFLDFIINKI